MPGWVSGDTFVVGMFASGTDSRTTNNDGTTSKVTGPGVGGNLMFIRGGFSADATIQDNHYGVNTSVQGFTGLGVDVASVTSNVQYKFDWKTWWIEPTAGVQVTDSYWDGVAKGLGFTNGHQVRVQGGVRFGATLATWTDGGVQAIFGGYAYNDVKITGGTLAAVAAATRSFRPTKARRSVEASQSSTSMRAATSLTTWKAKCVAPITCLATPDGSVRRSTSTESAVLGKILPAGATSAGENFR